MGATSRTGALIQPPADVTPPEIEVLRADAIKPVDLEWAFNPENEDFAFQTHGEENW
jgi:hypothetical protein